MTKRLACPSDRSGDVHERQYQETWARTTPTGWGRILGENEDALFLNTKNTSRTLLAGGNSVSSVDSTGVTSYPVAGSSACWGNSGGEKG